VSEALEQIVDKAAKDEDFRKLLLSNPNLALKGFNLTSDEKALLEGLTEETFDDFAGTLGGRITKGFMPGTGA
jgi:hypothetical protein